MQTLLLPSQKNQLFLITKEAGLDPAEFVWSEVYSKWSDTDVEDVAQVTHEPSGFYFIFDRVAHGELPRYFPSGNAAKEWQCDEVSIWDEVANEFKEWIEVVSREHIEPDLWLLSRSDKKLVAEKIDDLENTKFQPDEIQRISGAITEVREFLFSSSTYSEAQRKFIETRLQHLQDASNRLGRKDWITLAMGTLANIVVGAAFAPETARELLRTAGALLGWVVGSVHLIP